MDYRVQALRAREIAALIPVNESYRTNCPACGERTYSVTRMAHTVAWNCYRASCGVKGYSDMLPTSDVAKVEKRPKDLSPYNGPLEFLGEEDIAFFRERFGLSDYVSRYIRRSSNGYMLPVFDSFGSIRAYTRRHSWSGSPESPMHGHWAAEGIFQQREGALQGWWTPNCPISYPENPSCRKLVLVEDTVSAMCAYEQGIHAVALLGTNMTYDKAREIALRGADEVIIALDKDATDVAFKMARKWGMSWKKTRVALLDRDLKDEDPHQLHYLLGIDNA